MNKSAVPFLGALIGLMCALGLLLVWRQDPVTGARPEPRMLRPGSSSTATSSFSESLEGGATTFSDPAVRALIDKLAQMLARHDVRSHESILTFKDDAALARFLARAGKAGLEVIGRIDALRAVRVKIGDLRGLQDELLQNASDYTDLSGNYIFGVPQAPAKESRTAVDQIPFGNDALAFVGANGDRSQWGRGVTIAVLDTGIASDPTFGAGRVSALDVGFGISPGNATDDGHGTSVASLAAGMSPDAPGVSPAASLLSIRVTDANSTSDIFTLSQAIVAAVDAGARIINVSLGGYGTNSALEAAIGYAQDHGSVIVAAAGNDQAAQLAWPAADTRVISVGAVDKAGQQVTFSNSGSQLELTAPGYGVQTAWVDNQRVYVDGTSASSPIVAGAIAALMSQNPNLTANDAAQLLIKTASDAGAPGADPSYGNGILNLAWAMNANNPNYVDTAVSSHYFDAANNQMDFVVQNRSGQTITGLTLDVAAGTTTTDYTIPSLAAGATSVVKVPVSSAQLFNVGKIQYTTTLNNPLGVVDQVPANNRRSSVLTSPTTGAAK